MINIIIMGPPGSGKGTQSKFIINKYNLLYISIGDILRYISLDKKNILYKKINLCINSGKLLDDNLILDLINNYITNIDINYNGILLDGFPRNINQALLLKNINIKFNIIIEFIINYNYILDRIMGRMIHEKSGRIYHNKFYPPIKEGIDDITGEKLSIRTDDNIETINNRLKIYNDNLILLRKFFFKEFKNNNLYYNLVNSGINSNILKKSLFKVIESYINSLRE